MDSLEAKGIVAGGVYIVLVIILLSVFLEKYTEVLTLVAVGFAIYFAASGKLEELGGLGLKLKFRQLKEQQIPPKQEEILGGRITPTEDTEVAEKGSWNFLRGTILPAMVQKRYTTLSIRQGVRIDETTLRGYLDDLSTFEFFKHVIFVNSAENFVAHMFAETLLRMLKTQGESIVKSINEWRLDEIPSIVKDSIKRASTYSHALNKMREIGLDYIPITDEYLKFAGVITKKEITDMIFDKILLPSK